MASSSMDINVCNDYDVFLSFRGDDTRNNFTSHLYDALRRNGIKVFIDNKIDRGEEITSVIEKVIEGVQLSIIVFSPDYASSTFCLDELAKIMECRESKAQIVLPIFYKVDPSKDTYREAFGKHKADFRGKRRRREETIKQQLKKVKRWKSAFRKALNLGGWPIDDKRVEAEIIGEIIRDVMEKLNCEPSCQSKGEELISTSLVGQTVQSNFKMIWECLINEETSKVGIHGMGGVGKTTIATRIHNQLLEVASLFTHIYWITVSKNSSIYKLQSDIAKVLELDLSRVDDEKKRAAKLWKELQSKKFVLILDDVWEAFEMENVGIPILAGRSKLLLTTRKLQVCKRMDCQPFHVKPLSKHEAWDLFIKESKFQINAFLEWREIVESIVKDCAGLPLAIVVIARRMKGVVEISEWRDVLRVLKKPCEGKNHEMEEQVFKPLKFSYDSLPDYQYRRCFLYYSLFPEDYELRCDILNEYLIGEGLIDKLDSIHAEFDRGNAIINELANASLLELRTNDAGRKFVKMHDVVKDMALIVIREKSNPQDGLQLQGLSEENQRCFNLKSVLSVKDSMFDKGAPNLALNCSKLSTLIIEKDYLSSASKFPSCFFANMQNLAVLDMRFLELLKLLPDSISNLGNLRVLRLHGCCKLEYIPSLAGLQNLCHLDLHYTNLKDIPNGLEGLINLNVLKLSWTEYSLRVFFPSVDLEKLSHLQILQLEHVEVEPDMLIRLQKLETLKIVFYNLESLNSYLKSGHWQRLVEYYIVYSREKGSCADGMREEDSYNKVMYFYELEDFGGRKGETDIVLPYNIQYLIIEEWNGPMADVLMNSTFDNLQYLEIYGCGGMHLFTPSLARQVFHNVESLYIGWFRTNYEVEEIISPKEEFIRQINNTYTTIELPKLNSLTLMGLTNLTSIYKGRMVCPSLERIQIDGCERLQRLPFCMQQERNEENPGMIPSPIKLVVSDVSMRWWDSLQWDNANAKSRYQLELYNCHSE